MSSNVKSSEYQQSSLHQPTRKCSLCFMQSPSLQVYENQPCSHKYCMDCIKQRYIPNQDYVKCFYILCGFFIKVNELEDYFFQNDLKQIGQIEEESKPIDQSKSQQQQEQEFQFIQLEPQKQFQQPISQQEFIQQNPISASSMIRRGLQSNVQVEQSSKPQQQYSSLSRGLNKQEKNFSGMKEEQNYQNRKDSNDMHEPRIQQNTLHESNIQQMNEPVSNQSSIRKHRVTVLSQHDVPYKNGDQYRQESKILTRQDRVIIPEQDGAVPTMNDIYKQPMQIEEEQGIIYCGKCLLDIIKQDYISQMSCKIHSMCFACRHFVTGDQMLRAYCDICERQNH